MNDPARTYQGSSSKNFLGHIKRLTKIGNFEKMLALVSKVKGKYLGQIFKFFTPTSKKFYMKSLKWREAAKYFQ